MLLSLHNKKTRLITWFFYVYFLANEIIVSETIISTVDLKTLLMFYINDFGLSRRA